MKEKNKLKQSETKTKIIIKMKRHTISAQIGK